MSESSPDPMKCQRIGCTHTGLYHPRAKFYSPRGGDPIVMYMSLRVCREHSHELIETRRDWLHQCAAPVLAGFDIDYDRTELDMVTDDDPGYQKFLAIRDGRYREH